MNQLLYRVDIIFISNDPLGYITLPKIPQQIRPIIYSEDVTLCF